MGNVWSGLTALGTGPRGGVVARSQGHLRGSRGVICSLALLRGSMRPEGLMLPRTAVSETGCGPLSLAGS